MLNPQRHFVPSLNLTGTFFLTYLATGSPRNDRQSDCTWQLEILVTALIIMSHSLLLIGPKQHINKEQMQHQSWPFSNVIVGFCY